MHYLQKKESKDFVGIDLQSTNVKLLEFTRSDNAYQVQNFGVAPLTKVSTADNDAKNIANISQAITNLCQNIKMSSANAAIAINGSLAMIKELTIFKSKNDADIEAQVWTQAEESFKNMIDNINLDFHVLGDSKTNSSKLDVLAVACRKDIIQTHIDVVQPSGLKLQIIDVNYYALERAFSLLEPQLPSKAKNKTVAMLNIDSTIATFIVIKDYDLIYSYEQELDAQPIENWLLSVLEDKKSSISKKLIDKTTKNLALQALHLLELFNSSKLSCQIDYLILAGEYATLPNIAATVKKETKIETLIANPFAEVTFNKKIAESAIKKIAPAFTICCGLAIRGTKND